MRIAVCLSGQPRTIEYAKKSILSFFEDRTNDTFDFFCHAWDYNTWKVVSVSNSVVYSKAPEPVDTDWLIEQLECFNPVVYEIQNSDVITKNEKYRNIGWASLFYSAMKANHLKRLHEMKNNFRYDLVVRGRFDMIFYPYHQFNYEFSHKIKNRVLYHPHASRMKPEYNLINASDPFFYGDSWAMDIISDMPRNLVMANLYNQRFDNYRFTGPGTLMSEVCKSRNIEIKIDNKNIGEIIYRKELSGKDPVTDYQELLRMHNSYYE